jgi:thioredoxin-like negative regulator of GroEL
MRLKCRALIAEGELLLLKHPLSCVIPVVLGIGLACGLPGLTGGKGAGEGDALLKSGDLAGASGKYEEAIKADPSSLDVAIGVAYTRMLAGSFAEADAALAGAEAKAAEKLPEIKLRRALVAMQAGDLDKVKEHATASGLPAAKLILAEVELADGNRDAARGILEGIQGDTGSVGATAKQYLALMADPNPLVQGLSETQALWALGQHKVAVRSVEELVKAYAETHEDGGEQVLLWAGRAAALGETEAAWGLIEAVGVPPAGQNWRVEATKGIAWCAEADGAKCLEIFEGLSKIAPQDGYIDARVTAASVIAPRDPATARKLLEGMSGDGAARVLVMLGDKAAAAAMASDPILKKQLGG